MVDKTFTAMKALVVNSGKVLILKEDDYEDGTNEGKWSLIGGRIEPGEDHREALKREVEEEAGLEVKIGSPVSTGEWRPEVRGEKWQIVATFLECKAANTDVDLGEEHSDYKWIEPEKHQNYNLIGNLHSVFEDFIQNRQEATGKPD